ncbi:MAG: sulfite oxidase heme-binding subunit YedZ [Vicinamibacteria bacterium]
MTALLGRARATREPRGFGMALLCLACLPAAFATLALASDLLRRTRFLGSNPVKEAEHFLGEWTLRLLLATLCVTPLRQLLGWHWLARHRRTLGLLAFGYATLHWLVYALLDVQLDWAALLEDLTKRPYIMIGMGGLLLLLPLAVTSTQAMIRRLGGRRWSLLHRLVYPAAVLGVVHFWMAVKADIRSPLLFAAGFGLLFAWRLWRARK